MRFIGSKLSEVRGDLSRDDFCKSLFMSTNGELNISAQRIGRLEKDDSKTTLNTNELGILCHATGKSPNHYYGI